MTHTDRNRDVTVCERPAARDEPSASAADRWADGSHGPVRDQLSDYLEGSLPTAEAARVREHLDVCPSCGAFWDTFRLTVEATHRLPTYGLSNEAKRHLLDQVARVGSPAKP